MDPMEGEQTWPTEEELAAAEGMFPSLPPTPPHTPPPIAPFTHDPPPPLHHPIAGVYHSLSVAHGERRIRLVPKGTSEYQAAWIMDNGSEVCVCGE